MEYVAPQLFDDAIKKLGAKSPLAARLTSAQWRLFPLAIHERAQFSARVENVRFLARVQSLLNEFLTGARNDNGTLKVGGRADFVLQLRKFALAEGMGPLDPRDAGTVRDITSEPRLGLIFEIQTQSARGYGQWLQGMDADLLNEFPAYRFVRVQSVAKPRPLHEDNEDRVRLKTDLRFWLDMNAPAIGGFDVPWPPFGFSSGMGLEEVDRTEAEDLGLLDPDTVLESPVEDFNRHLSASTSGLDPHLVDWMIQQLPGKVFRTGDRVEFRPNLRLVPPIIQAPPVIRTPPVIPSP